MPSMFGVAAKGSSVAEVGTMALGHWHCWVCIQWRGEGYKRSSLQAV